MGEAHGSPSFPPPFPRGGCSRSRTNCTPGKGAMAASFSARGRGSTCPPPAHVVQVTHTWRRRPLAPPGGDVAARRGRQPECGAGIAGGTPGADRDCGDVAGARPWRSSPGPLGSLSVPGPWRAAPSAGEVRCAGMVQLLSDGARSPGPARTCRRGHFCSCPAPAAPFPGRKDRGDGHAARNSPGGSPALVGAGGASVVPGSAVSACGPAAPGAAPRETRGSGR